MISVAGIRGIVGDSLTPPVASRFSAAFASALEPGPIVVGRDARPSGDMMRHAVIAGLTGAGRDVIDVGLATTPTTQIAVEQLRAAGGVIITASHNPAPWNALKFLSPHGEFLGAAEGARVRERYEAGAEHWSPAAGLGAERAEAAALEWHLSRVLGLACIDVAPIRNRRLRVVVDGCASVGGIALPALLEGLGATVVRLDCDPTGRFTRELEPLPEHLGALGSAVREAKADFGVAVDPDADRAAFVDAAGKPLGEEYTVAIGAWVALEHEQGPVVTNLSTSRMLDAVCARFGVPLHRSRVGEAYVVTEMRSRGAVAGGEGNGGMILPAAHYGRDSLVAVALVAHRITKQGTSLRAVADQLPRYSMLKDKLARPDTPWDRAALRLRESFRDHTVDSADGLRFSRDEEWVHVRPSGTEPVVRVIAESPLEQRTRELIERARHALEAVA
jgi:phosphomannomutase